MNNVGQMCGEGSHQVCQEVHFGMSVHHFNDPDADTGVPFVCACGCHYAPHNFGMVPVPDRAAQLPVLSEAEYTELVEQGAA
jgi:hypothetical protein